eukprot:m.1209720 g.1209720  ORF g.1209720 m.1209720 type:complete len:209 (-) comp24591_c2_seq10:38-664(-)
MAPKLWVNVSDATLSTSLTAPRGTPSRSILFTVYSLATESYAEGVLGWERTQGCLITNIRGPRVGTWPKYTVGRRATQPSGGTAVWMEAFDEASAAEPGDCEETQEIDGDCTSVRGGASDAALRQSSSMDLQRSTLAGRHSPRSASAEASGSRSGGVTKSKRKRQHGTVVEPMFTHHCTTHPLAVGCDRVFSQRVGPAGGDWQGTCMC